MSLPAIIDRLKANAPLFAGNVAGAAEFSAEAEAMRLPLPMAFVMRNGSSTSEATTLGEVLQLMTEEYAVVIAVDNSTDTLGHAAEQLLEPVIEQVRKALLGWTWDTLHNGMTFSRDDHVGFDRARLWHQMIFSTESVIASLDL